MEYTIRKCAFTYERSEKNNLMKEAFQSAGFTPKDADEFLEIDEMEKIYTRGDISVRFVIMDKPEKFFFMFQYHIFENYADEINIKKEKMQKALLRKQNGTFTPTLRSVTTKVAKKENIQIEHKAAATIDFKEPTIEPVTVEMEQGNDSKPHHNVMLDEDVPEGQFSLFDM